MKLGEFHSSGVAGRAAQQVSQKARAVSIKICKCRNCIKSKPIWLESIQQPTGISLSRATKTQISKVK
jgi:hypothetical protein